MRTPVSMWTCLALLAVVAGPASAQIGLDYLGAFKTGLTGVYGGDIAYYPAGNGGAGSLFLTGTDTTVRQVSLPALVKTTDVNLLNTATQLGSFSITSGTPHGVAWRSTDNRLYFSQEDSTNTYFWSIDPDGANRSATQTARLWNVTGTAIFEIPDAWAASYAGGRNLVALGGSGSYGIAFTAVDPYNDPLSTSKLVEYQFGHLMTGYSNADRYDGAAWVGFGSDADIIVSGRVSAADQATFWFYKAGDIAGAAQLYDPQPYRILSVDAVLFNDHRIYGLTYDPTHQILYGYEGKWQSPTIVHAWAVTPEPLSAFLLAAGLGLAAIRRR